MQPTLGFTLAEICRAQNKPTLMIPQLLKIKPCKDYTETPLQTLDGLYVTQPKRFLPLTQEVKKLAEDFSKEEIASQWAGLPPEKLLQESFVEQLDHPPLSKTYVHGMVEAEEEPGVSNCMATDYMVKKQGCWKAD